jgi:hypothetical protein
MYVVFAPSSELRDMIQRLPYLEMDCSYAALNIPSTLHLLREYESTRSTNT